jgi:uncharacterized protein YdaU (DUF1376 family)
VAEQPWIPFYFADYIADTAALSLAEHGAYLLLMAEAYRHGGRLPCDRNADASPSHRTLHRLCRCEDEKERWAVDAVLRRFFLFEGDYYRHPRIEKELARRVERSEKAAQSATAGWRRRRGGDDADGMRTHSDRNANASETQMRSGCESDAVTATVIATATVTPTPTTRIPAKPVAERASAPARSTADGQVKTGPSQKTRTAIAWLVDNRRASPAKIKDMRDQDSALSRAIDLFGGWSKWSALEQNSPEDMAERGRMMRCFGAACAERQDNGGPK